MAEVQLARRDFIIAIPVALFLNALAGVLLANVESYYLISYATFVFICCYLVVWEEFHNFPEIHDQKSPLVETLLAVVGTIGLMNVLKAGTDLTKVAKGLLFFLGSGVIWQAYTMWTNNYFASDTGGWISWIRPANPLSLFGTPPERLHRDEYRYWLLGEGLQFMVITFVLLFVPSFLRTQIAFKIVVIGGSLGQAYNLWRYYMVRKRCKMRRVGTELTDSVNQSQL
jgi:hypothetical protein